MRYLPLLLLLILYGCTGAAQQAQELDVAAFDAGISKSTVQLLDVRTAGEFRDGHIKGALQANWNNRTEFKERMAALNPQEPVYVYCLSGSRSSAAAAWLRHQGFREVLELKGGFLSWKRNEMPVAAVKAQPQMDMQTFRTMVADTPFALVDFGADWCPPCRKIEPIVQAFLKEHPEVKLVKIDGGVHTNLMKALNAEGLPTLLLYRNGTERWRHQGVVTAAELTAMWQQLQ